MLYFEPMKQYDHRQICLPASHAVLNSFGVLGNSWSRNLQISRDSFNLLSPQSRVGTCSHFKLIKNTCVESLLSGHLRADDLTRCSWR